MDLKTTEKPQDKTNFLWILSFNKDTYKTDFQSANLGLIQVIIVRSKMQGFKNLKVSSNKNSN